MSQKPLLSSLDKGVPLTRQLSFRLVRNVILVAVPLGLAFVAGQVLVNFAGHKAGLDDTARQVFNIVESPVTHTVWTLDKKGGDNFATGVLRHDAIVRVEILDRQGKTFSLARKQDLPGASLASRMLFGGYREYRLPLTRQISRTSSIPIGTLVLTLDPRSAAHTFVKRSTSILISGILITAVLAGVLICVFHFSLVKALLLAAASLSHILPENIDGKRIHLPGKHRQDELGRFIHHTNNLLEAVEKNSLSREKAENEVRRLNRDLEARVKDRTRELEAFTYSVTHDLRTSVRTIEGFSLAMVEDCGHLLDDKGKTYLEFLRSEGVQMTEHIDALLALSKTTSEGIHRETIDLSDLARHQAEILARSASGPCPKLRIQDGVTAFADRRLITVVLKNLLENAFKYTGKTDRPCIEFGADLQKNETVFYVKDNGTGFDMSQADQLFLPFRRIHRNDEFSGTGIGLATVERIVRRHNGAVWAESGPDQGASGPGRGAAFYFTLGREKETASAGSSGREPEMP